MLCRRNIACQLERSIIRLSARSLASSVSNNNGNTHQQYSYHQSRHGETPLFLGAALWGALSAGAALTFMEQAKIRRPRDDEKADAAAVTLDEGHVKHGRLDNQPPRRPDLPTYTMEQVAEHSDEESMWFSFRGGVYDLTFFTMGHPGGTPVSQPYTYCNAFVELLSKNRLSSQFSIRFFDFSNI
jgi:hypothetical protein